MTNFYEQVYALVRRVPCGKVTSYGRVARMLGRPRAARAVGYALNGLPDQRKNPAFVPVPWQRVVNRIGQISIANREFSSNLQADLLREEGVAVNDQLRLINFEQDLWEGLPLWELEEIMGMDTSTSPQK
ncbi:MAG TPA: MGMT family protein [Anaerolineae bacterium]|nr:MGMT family protein [Anaerolineae bacterium]